MQNESYFLLPLEVKHSASLDLNDKRYKLVEHHLSVYETLVKTTAVHCPIHYTGKYSSGTETIIVHAYFDKFGNYLRCNALLDDGARTPLVSTVTEQAKIQKLAGFHAGPFLNQLLNEFIQAQETSKQMSEDTLKALEEESRNGMHSKRYRKLLVKTIAAFDDRAKLDFFADCAVKNSLQRHRTFLLTKHISKKSQNKTEAKSTAEQESERQEFAYDAGRDLSPSNGSNAKSSIEHKQLSEQRTSSDSYTERKQALYLELKTCEPNNLNNILTITKQLDSLEKSRTQILIEACIKGDLATLKRYLKKSDTDLLVHLLSTCVYHNHPELFKYIHTISPFTCDSYGTPYITSNPIAYAGVRIPTPLGIAFERRNLAFFIALLREYSCNPMVTGPFDGLSLFKRTLGKSSPIEYSRALIEAGVSLEVDGTSTFHISIESKAGGKLLPIEIQKIQQTRAEYAPLCAMTPLAFATIENNSAGIKLLLEHIAKPIIFTPHLAVAMKGHFGILLRLLENFRPPEEIDRDYQHCKTQMLELVGKQRRECQQFLNKRAEARQREQNFSTAENLYYTILILARNDDERHIPLYNLSICQLEMGNTELACKTLIRCIAIRQKLAENPIKNAGLKPLITTAGEKLLEALGKSRRVEAPTVQGITTRLI